jgi:hypothetical protein
MPRAAAAKSAIGGATGLSAADAGIAVASHAITAPAIIRARHPIFFPVPE